MADQVSEADILELFRNRPAEASSRAVEDYRQSQVRPPTASACSTYAMMDAAASLASTVESAQGSFDDLTANGNLSRSVLKSLWLLDHRLGVSALCPQSCPIIVPASSGRQQRP